VTARCRYCGSTDAEHLTGDTSTIGDASVWCDPWCCDEKPATAPLSAEQDHAEGGS